MIDTQPVSHSLPCRPSTSDSVWTAPESLAVQAARWEREGTRTHKMTNLRGALHDTTSSRRSFFQRKWPSQLGRIITHNMYVFQFVIGLPRQASDPWTVTVSSLLALISRKYTQPVWTCITRFNILKIFSEGS